MMSDIIVPMQSAHYSQPYPHTRPHPLPPHTPHHTPPLTPPLTSSSSLQHSPQQLDPNSQSVPITLTIPSLNQYEMAHLISYLLTLSTNKIHCLCIINISPNAHCIVAIVIVGYSQHILCKMHLSCTCLLTYCIKIIIVSKNQSQSHTICQYNLLQCHLYRCHYQILISIKIKYKILVLVDLFLMGFMI